MKFTYLMKVILLLSCTSFLGGCWNNKDINKRFLPVMMGVGEGEGGKLKIMLKIPQPSEGTMRLIEAESQTISKAIDIMRTKAEVSIDMLHLKLILVSESIAKKGIIDITEYTFRSREIAPKALMAIVSGDLEGLMHDERKQGTGSTAYDFFSREAGWTPNISIVPIWKAFRSFKSDTEDVAIPIIVKGTDTLFRFLGSAMMQGDRMVGQISPSETLVYNLFEKKFTGGIVEVTDQASVSVVDASVSNQANWNSGPKMKSNLKLSVVIEEKKGGVSDAVIRKGLEGIIQKRFNRLSRKLQASQSDILGIGQYFRNMMSEEQRNHWKDEWFPKLEHEVTVDIIIRDSGNLK